MTHILLCLQPVTVPTTVLRHPLVCQVCFIVLGAFVMFIQNWYSYDLFTVVSTACNCTNKCLKAFVTVLDVFFVLGAHVNCYCTNKCLKASVTVQYVFYCIGLSFTVLVTLLCLVLWSGAVMTHCLGCPCSVIVAKLFEVISSNARCVLLYLVAI
jgi:hypothetical protein